MLPAQQEKIAMNMLPYIVADARPLSKVDSKHFMIMVGSLNPRFRMFTRNTLGSIIAKNYTGYI